MIKWRQRRVGRLDHAPRVHMDRAAPYGTLGSILLALLLLAGCASTRPCAIMDEDGDRLNIGMACECSLGEPIETMTCRRVK